MNSNQQDTRSIRDLIAMVDRGKLVLPEFQRDFKWPLEKSEVLFDSIFQDLFIGSLIISRPKFELACKDFDLRERGKSSRKPVPKNFSVQKFETEDIYTLLDGQQRVTSIYRALKGKDIIYLIFRDINEITSEEFYNLNEEKILVDHEKYIEGFDSSKPKSDEFFVRICDLYTAIVEDYRENRFLEEFVNERIEELQVDEQKKAILQDYSLTVLKTFNVEILSRANLLSVQLLNMGLEKFCTYFERSNSQGLNLNFTDIITAKVYIDFKLSREIKEASKLEYFNDKYVDLVVRYINFIEHGEVTKNSILKDLTGKDFERNWHDVVKDIDYVQRWLKQEGLVFDISKIPYKTMLLPVLSFYQNLPNKEFSQASEDSIKMLKFWFFSSIVDNRYGGARHGSTNVVLKKDLEVFKKLAKGNFPDSSYWQQIRIEYSFEEFKRLDHNNSAKFMGLNFLMWYNRKFLNIENGAQVSMDDNIDVHHIFPSNYIERKFGDESEEYDFSDSILNKIRINKKSNIKISNKCPSDYLKEIVQNCSQETLFNSLDSHYVPNPKKLLDGDYDEDFIGFLELRYKEIEPIMISLKQVSENLNSGNNNISI